MIDADLYQMLTLGLLGLILLVSLLIYSAVASLRKSGGAPQVLESTTPAMATTDYSAAPQPAPQALATPVVAEVAPAAQAAVAQPAATATVAGSAVAEPQDQPFERDGRWWFRRGAELLVYDEGTGQWVAAPAGGSAAPAAAAVGTAVGTAPVAGEVAGAFWKCPSCGAVNGATASTCRMCFTARP